MLFKTLPAKVKAGPDSGLAEGEFIVYPSTFTREPDAYGDVVAPGAFARGIEQRKSENFQLPGLFGHRMDDPDFYIAYAIEEEEDDHGWRIHGAFDLESPKGPHVYRLAKAGRIRELSFAYDTLDEGQVTLENGVKANELRDVDVFEFSFVPVGANRDTSIVAVKALADAVLADVKAGRAISAKNEKTLLEAVDKILAAATNIKTVLQVEDPEEEDAGTASGSEKAKDEDRQVKSEEPIVVPSALTRLHLELATAELAHL